MNAGKLDEAFELGLQAMAGGSRAADRDQVAWQYPLSEPIRKLSSDSRPPANQDDNGDVITSGGRTRSIRVRARQRQPVFPRTLKRNPRSSFSQESPAAGKPQHEKAFTDAS